LQNGWCCVTFIGFSLERGNASEVVSFLETDHARTQVSILLICSAPAEEPFFIFICSSVALSDSASEFRNEGRKYKEEKGGCQTLSAFDKRAGRVSAHLLGRASSVLRSKRLKDGRWSKILKGGQKWCKMIYWESGSAYIYIHGPEKKWRRCKTRDRRIDNKCQMQEGHIGRRCNILEEKKGKSPLCAAMTTCTYNRAGTPK
jgi:hypothetical protein